MLSYHKQYNLFYFFKRTVISVEFQLALLISAHELSNRLRSTLTLDYSMPSQQVISAGQTTKQIDRTEMVGVRRLEIHSAPGGALAITLTDILCR